MDSAKLLQQTNDLPILTFLAKGKILAHILALFLANYKTFESHELNFNAGSPQSVANFWIVLNVFAEILLGMVEQ